MLVKLGNPKTQNEISVMDCHLVTSKPNRWSAGLVYDW